MVLEKKKSSQTEGGRRDGQEGKEFSRLGPMLDVLCALLTNATRGHSGGGGVEGR